MPDLTTLQEALGHSFQDEALLVRALTHSSAEQAYSYERLEFLGDAVLALCMAEDLFKKYEGDAEGMLSRRLAAQVRKETLARIGHRLSLPDYIVIGPGDDPQRDSIVADVVEALLAGVYLDAGLETVRSLIDRLWAPERGNVRLHDGKSMLQEWLQARKLPLPKYEIVGEEGSDHTKVFTASVRAAEKTAQGEGSSKQKAEQAAADALLEVLKA